MLGDIVIAYETVAREAAAEGSRSRIISRILRCMDFCIFSAMIMRSTRRPRRWSGWKRAILARLGMPDPYVARDAED